MKEAFTMLEKQANKLGLEIEGKKTKYLKAGKNQSRTKHNKYINKFKFETVDNFSTWALW